MECMGDPGGLYTVSEVAVQNGEPSVVNALGVRMAMRAGMAWRIVRADRRKWSNSRDIFKHRDLRAVTKQQSSLRRVAVHAGAH